MPYWRGLLLWCLAQNEGNHPPIYEDLPLERGDVVTDAQSAAEHAQHQAARLLGRHRLNQPPYPGCRI